MVSAGQDPSPSTASSSDSVPIIQPSILTSADNHNSLIVINVSSQCPIKLTKTNYASWHQQFMSLLIGYDLVG